jgi:hypothetical protein
MLVLPIGRTNALRALLQSEQDRGLGFLRLAKLCRHCILSKVKKSVYWTQCFWLYRGDL